MAAAPAAAIAAQSHTSYSLNASNTCAAVV